MSRRAVITGLGPITCAGTGKDRLWASIRAGRSGISRISCFDTNECKALCGGEIRDWNPSAFFPPHRLKRLDRFSQFSVASALLAHLVHGLALPLCVKVRGGDVLTIDARRENDTFGDVTLTGPATEIFSGEIRL